MESTVLAHGVTQEQVEYRACRVADGAVAMNHCGRVCLKILSDGVVSLAQESVGLGGFDEINVTLKRQRSPVQEIPTARGAVERDLIGPEDEASEGVPGIAYASEVAPGTSRVASVHANAVPVNAAQWFANYLIVGRAAHVAQDELIGRERDCFAHGGGRETFSECRGGGFGGLVRRGCKNGLTVLVNPVLVGGASADGPLQKSVPFE